MAAALRRVPSPAERSAAGDGTRRSAEAAHAPGGRRARRASANGNPRWRVTRKGGDKGRAMVYRISAVETGTALVATATVFPSAVPRSVPRTYRG